MAKKNTTVLLILDGYGINENEVGNAIVTASTPTMDMLKKDYPFVKGAASGLEVGLPDGQMGNSEVGHLNIGAGRVVYQELTRITKSIAEGDFFNNKTLLDAINNCKNNNSDLHLYGLLSDGGVHSHNTHLYALLKMAKDNGLSNVFVHAFLDGRDTPPASGKGYVEELEQEMQRIGVGKIATISGRYYAMDRDKRWERVEIAYNALVNGKGESADSAALCMEKTYEKGVNDEFVMPTIILADGKPTATIKENDSVIFFNFRPDRAREITRTLVDPDFDGFKRDNFFPLKYICFTEYDSTMPNVSVAFSPQTLENTLGEYLANNGMKQLRIAETEKYAHVTFFFNGGVEEPYKGEDRILVPSPKVATYDLQPEMSVYEVADKLAEAIRKNEYDLIIANFANADMVGHTGFFDAAKKACEDVDKCIKKVYDAVIDIDGVLFICADHGNSDQMVDYKTNEAFTAHTTNPVPFVLVNYKDDKKLREGGRLCDIAPTLLEIMETEIPVEMTGKSLLI